MQKQDLAEAMNHEVAAISDFLKSVEAGAQNTSIDGKWSVAENMVHLSKSIRPVNLSFILPKFTLLIFGKASHSRSYDEVVAAYQAQLKSGAKASLPFVPFGSKEYDPEKIRMDFVKDYHACIRHFSDWSDDELRTYRLPHPILRIITMMEMLQFSLYHLRHHHATMQDLVKRIA